MKRTLREIYAEARKYDPNCEPLQDAFVAGARWMLTGKYYKPCELFNDKKMTMEIPDKLVNSNNWKMISTYMYLKKKFFTRDGDCGVYVTSREIATAIGFKSNNSANMAIHRLNDLGYLEAHSETKGTFIQFSNECSR